MFDIHKEEDFICDKKRILIDLRKRMKNVNAIIFRKKRRHQQMKNVKAKCLEEIEIERDYI